MGKPTGFIEYLRELPLDRSAIERIRDWNEFHLHLDEKKLREQGARCMDCGIPFCHTGTILNRMASGCPVNNLIPEWNDLVYRGLWREALERLHKTNNFPEFTGRVCPAPCEGACVLGINAPPVTIKNIECAIIDKGFEEGWVKPEPPEVRTGKRVAVIGSGPAGLACAAQLNKAGHWVTVFERSDRVGGLLLYGIPNMKLDKRLVQRRVDLLAEEGVVFRTHTEIGKDIPADQLVKDYDAVVLCTGATKPKDLPPVEGRNLQGIHYAMEFLQANTKSLLDSEHRDGHFLSAAEKDVIVVGGGDTGTDCVGTSMRHGCRTLVQFEILPKPPQDRAPDNPWPQWPKVYRLDYGQEEALVVFGDDPRVYCTTVKRFVGDETGSVKEAHTVQIGWVQENGRYVPQEIPGTEKVVPTQLVLLALGFHGPEDAAIEQLGIERDAQTNAKAAFEKYQTSLPNVFAAGDARRGQSLIVWAIREGRGAARECDRYLMGETNLP